MSIASLPPLPSQVGKHSDALRMALKLGSRELAEQAFAATAGDTFHQKQVRGRRLALNHFLVAANHALLLAACLPRLHGCSKVPPLSAPPPSAPTPAPPA